MHKRKIKFFYGTLAFLRRGTGDKVLICLHGFGQSAQVYDSFFVNFGEEFTIYSLDLFYHGDSEWNNKRKPLQKEEWQEVFLQFLKEENISSFSLMAYSLGGKFALAITEKFAAQLETLTLLAPDGLKTQFWYDLSNYPPAFKRFFRGMILKPKYYRHLIRYSSKIGLISKSITKFTENELGSRAKRRRFYLSWVNFRLFVFDWNRIKIFLNRYEIPFILITGKYDKIIQSEKVDKYVKGLNQQQHIVLDSGHNQLIDVTAQYLRKNPQLLLN